MASNPNYVDEMILSLAADLARETQDLFIEESGYLPSDEGTPIERLMGISLAFALRSIEWFGGESWGAGAGWPDIAPAEALSSVPYREGISIWFQAPVDKYRADFLVCLAGWKGGYVFGAIECDGHDHHNLTKAQAEHDRKRDRFFQSRGIIILRYTGSEIWKRPLKSAVDAITILKERSNSPESKRWRQPD